MSESTPDFTEIKAITERLTRRLDDIAKRDEKIINALKTEEDIIEETELTLTFQNNLHYWILKITQFMEDSRMPVSSFQTSNHINLPKLHIQPFDGNSLEWLTFWDSFSNAVHDNANISNIDKT